MSKQSIGVGVIGYGVVGKGVVEMMQTMGNQFAAMVGSPVVLAAVARRTPMDERMVCDQLGESVFFTTDPVALIEHPSVDIVVELIGGTGDAPHFVRAALAKKKPVVSANKAMIAECGLELFSLAHKNAVPIGIEASVAGAVPIIAALERGYNHNAISTITGIVNGTCNFILSKMSNEGASFDDALKEAQSRGYAEATPDLDIDGSDSLHKIIVLIMLLHRVHIPFASCHRCGITEVETIDIRFGRELGLQLKPIVWCRSASGSVSVRVEPAFVSTDSLLGQLGSAQNGIEVQGNYSGDLFFAGEGAGSHPTASAVLADVLALAKHLRDKSYGLPDCRPITSGTAHCSITTSWYLRITLIDTPGSLNSVSQLFSKEAVNIEHLSQNHDDAALDNGVRCVPLILITEPLTNTRIDALMSALESLSVVQGPIVRYAIHRSRPQ